jgi:hypothetical protein
MTSFTQRSFRRSTPFVLAAAVPAFVAFVLTVRPAEVFAEAGVAPPICAAASGPCDGRAFGESCAPDKICVLTSCRSDAGETARASLCAADPANSCSTPVGLALCAGKAEGAPCGEDHVCETFSCPTADGGATPLLRCVPHSSAASEPPGGTASASPSPPPSPSSGTDGGCSSSRGEAGGSSAIGMVFALSLYLRSRRRRSA